VLDIGQQPRQPVQEASDDRSEEQQQCYYFDHNLDFDLGHGHSEQEMVAIAG
jgi:hypothetical protein